MEFHQIYATLCRIDDLRECGVIDTQQCLSFMHKTISLYGEELNKVNSESSDPVFLMCKHPENISCKTIMMKVR